MKFAFRDITKSEIYETARVLFVCGPYNIFNNIAIDTVRDICKPETIKSIQSSLMEDFMDGMGDISDNFGNISISNTIDVDTFMHVVSTAPMMGLWFCNVGYSFMTKKQLTWLNEYIKSPSANGRLVVYCGDFKDYRKLLKNNVINNSSQVHLIQLSFPSRGVLEQIVRTVFNNKGYNIESNAVDLFIMRMSSSYDDYEEIIDKIISESAPSDSSTGDTNRTDGTGKHGWKYTITYDNVLDAMKGIENFVLDDFIARLIEPLATDKATGKNKIYRMLKALTDEFGSKGLVGKLSYKIDDYIAFRMLINQGVIPIKVRFSVPEAKGRIGDEHRLSKISDYSFRKMALIASKTSLTDWEYMKLIIGNAKGHSSESYERVLYSLINRTVLNESRLNNDIGVENIFKQDLDRINKISYDENSLGEQK